MCTGDYFYLESYFSNKISFAWHRCLSQSIMPPKKPITAAKHIFLFENFPYFIDSIELFVLQNAFSMQLMHRITELENCTNHKASRFTSNSLTYFAQIKVRKKARNHGLVNGHTCSCSAHTCDSAFLTLPVSHHLPTLQQLVANVKGLNFKAI